MLAYISQRLLHAIPVLIGISLLTFAMLHLVPGDPVLIFAGDKPLTEERAAQLRHQLGLDRPIWEQYWDYASHALRGDLGVGLRSQRPVRDSILEVLPGTLQLTFAALLLILFFSFRLGWFPATGQGGIERLVLPAAALGLASAAALARLVRSSMLAVLNQEYIVTARAKGLTDRAVIMRHALKNALIPTVTMLGLQLGALLGGAVVTETIFSRPGLGRLAIDAIAGRDFPLIQGTVLFAAVTYVLVNLVVDVLYAAIDPRIRYK